MTNWTLTGTLGAGKSKTGTFRTFEYLASGKKVASNMDFFLENYFPPHSKVTYTRLPDFPTADQLWQLGKATDSKNEADFGLVVLDELAVYLNSREWQGKTRDAVIKYLRHIRKQHWHTMFLTQDVESLDAQIRRALIEHTVTCKRTDRYSIPFIGRILRYFGLEGRLPKYHIGIVRYGKSETSTVVDTWYYRGNSVDNAYDTDQKYTEFNDIVLKGTLGDFNAEVEGMYTVLSAWHLKGRYMTLLQRLKPFLNGLLSLSFLVLILCFTYIAYFDKPFKQVNAVNPSTYKPKFYVPADVIQLPEGRIYISDTDTYIFYENQSYLVDMKSQDDKFNYYFANKKWFSIQKVSL